LQDAGASVSVFARDAAKARLMADEFHIDAYDLAAPNFEGFDIVVNATPLGTRGQRESETPAAANQLRGVRLAYDLVYNPLETRFMRAARDAGCQVLGGLEMLIAQAVEQFKLWTNQQPDIDIMRAAAKRALESAD
jgi:shikimate 5-dehydrogenase